MFYIRQSATHKVVLGPAVAVGDGFTPVANLDVATSDEAEAILHDNGTVVDISGYTWAAIATADGYYHLTLQAAISGTVGHLTVVVNDDSLCLPLRADFTVLEEAVYDAMFAASAAGPLQATTAGRTLDIQATGEVDANLTMIGGVVQSATDLKDFADTGYNPTTHVAQSDLVYIHGSALTEGTSGYLAAAFVKLFDVASPVLVASDVMRGTDSANTTVPDAAGTAAGLHTTTDAAIAAVKAETALIVADTNELQTDDIPATLSTIAGYLDTEIAAILEDTGTTIPALIAALNNLSAAQVNAQVVDVVNVDALVAGQSLAEALRRIGALASGKVTGAGLGTETFKDYAESASTIVITVDGSGNRSAITYN